jgi:hypothetical protein
MAMSNNAYISTNITVEYIIHFRYTQQNEKDMREGACFGGGLTVQCGG